MPNTLPALRGQADALAWHAELCWREQQRLAAERRVLLAELGRVVGKIVAAVKQEEQS